MSDLLQRIQIAQRDAGEAACIADLERMGLVKPELPVVPAANFEAMFNAACVDLGLINEALGLDPDDGGAEPILDAIEELKNAAKPKVLTMLTKDELCDAYEKWFLKSHEGTWDKRMQELFCTKNGLALEASK